MDSNNGELIVALESQLKILKKFHDTFPADLESGLKDRQESMRMGYRSAIDDLKILSAGEELYNLGIGDE